MLKVVFLDWNGTLSTSKFWGHLEEKGGKSFSIFKKIEKSLFKDFAELLEPWMRGKYVSEEIIKLVSFRTKVNYNFVLKEFIKSCKNMNIVSNKFSQILQKIRSKGIKTIIATNNMDSFDRWTVSSLKLDEIFDGIINSYNVRALRQDLDSNNKSLFFKNYFETNKITPSECVFIGDGEDKNNAIEKTGIEHIQIRTPNETIEVLIYIFNKTAYFGR